MIVLIDTSTPVCRLSVHDNGEISEYEWQADRQLAKGLLSYLQETLAKHDATFDGITAIAVFKGPGSFTGLRIGLTVMNTLADSLAIPIVGESGDNWQQTALERLNNGQDDKIVLPDYGGDVHITKPRK